MTGVGETTAWTGRLTVVGVAVSVLVLVSSTREWAWMASPENGFTALELNVPVLTLGVAASLAGTIPPLTRGVWRTVAAAAAACVGLGIAVTCIGFVHDTESLVYAETMADGAPYVLVGYEVGETPWPFVVGGAGVVLAATGAAATVAAARDRAASREVG